MGPKQRSYSILNLILAGLGALLAGGVLLLYALQSKTLGDTSILNVIAGLGALAFLYYASIHQFLKKRFLNWSTLVLAIISTTNLALLILQTGGADSPFYSFWLLVIAASGLFGLLFTGISTALAVVLVIYSLARLQFQTEHLMHYLPQLLITLTAAGLAEWVLSRGRQPSTASSTPLTTDQLKAEDLVTHLADGVMVVDRNLKIRLFNPAAQQLTGWDLESAAGLHYRTVIHLKKADDTDVDDRSDPFIEAWTKKAPLVKNDLVALTRAGRKIELSISISPIYDASGLPSGGIGVFRDISQEKAVERQRNEFISTASHEMRTPVAAIEGYISLAMNPKVAAIDERAKGFLDKAHQNTQHLGDLFRDLLQITKMEDNQTPRSLAPVDIGQLARDAVADMQFAAQKKGITLTFTSTAGTDGSRSVTPLYLVMAEPERLREVVMNLLENAIKFTQVGGVTVRLTGDDNAVNISVADTGIGIAAEDLPHLFQKFYRIDNSATRTIGGTGLGLYLCRSIIELYSGRLWAESIPSKGSTFRFSLPRAKNVTLPAEGPQQAIAGNGPYNNKPQPVPVAATGPNPTPTTPAVRTAPTPAAAPNPAVPAPLAAAVPPSKTLAIK